MSMFPAHILQLPRRLIRPFAAYAGFCKRTCFDLLKVELIMSSRTPQRYSASITVVTMVQYSQVLLGSLVSQRGRVWPYDPGLIARRPCKRIRTTNHELGKTSQDSLFGRELF
jgi:hypothetical protein